MLVSSFLLMTSLQVHSTVLVSLLPSTSPEPSEDATLYIYIGLCVAAVVLIVSAVIVISLIVCLKKRQKMNKTDIVNVTDNIACGTSKDIDKMGLSSYGTTTFKGQEDPYYEYVSITVNNVIDSTTSASEAYATIDNVPVVDNQAYGMVHH